MVLPVLPESPPQEPQPAAGEEAHAGRRTLTLSVVIYAGSAGRWFGLSATVASLRAQLDAAAEILIVVDHDPELAERARQAFPECRIVHNQREPGLMGARNTGLDLSRGSIVAFLDDESAAEPDWTSAVLATFADPKVIGAGGRVRAQWPTGRPAWFPPAFDWVVDCTPEPTPREPTPVRAVRGPGICFRRAALVEIGGFSDQAGSDPSRDDEIETCLRLAEHNPDGVLLYQPTMIVRRLVHARQTTFAYFRERCFKQGRERAALNYRDETLGRRLPGSQFRPVSHGVPQTLWRVLAPRRRPERARLPTLGTLITGLVLAGAGYVAERLRPTAHDRVHGITRPRTEAQLWLAVAGRAALVLSLVLWAISLQDVRVENMTDLGLISVLPALFWISLALLTVGFALVLADARTYLGWLIAYVLALILVLHATPVLIYPTLRYSWAWKHVSIIDYLVRHGAVDPDGGELAAYHQWPGFFAFNAFLVRLAGIESTLHYAEWAPVFFNAAMLIPLMLLYRLVTHNRQLLWGALWVFYSCSWVGQDYFSPQATAFLLYLVVVAIVLRRFSRTRTPTRHSGGDVPAPPPPATPKRHRIAWTVLLVPLMLAVASTHQLTPLMMLAALGVIVLLRRYRNFGLLVVAVVIVVAWNSTVARPLLESRLHELIAGLGRLRENATGGFVDLGEAARGQVIVAWADRILSAGVWVLAFLGAWLRPGLRRAGFPVLLLAVAPLPFFAAGNYGGEIIFRVYLFALPATAFFAAAVLLPIRKRWVGVLGTPLLFLLMITGFFFGHFGKEQSNYFTPDEVALVQRLTTTAEEGSLILAPSLNMPAIHDNYERYYRLSFENLPPEYRERLLDDPVNTVIGLMDEAPPGKPGYFVVTRAQRAWLETTGLLPQGSVTWVQQEIERSGRFTVVDRNSAGVVFRFDPGSRR